MKKVLINIDEDTYEQIKELRNHGRHKLYNFGLDEREKKYLDVELVETIASGTDVTPAIKSLIDVITHCIFKKEDDDESNT